MSLLLLRALRSSRCGARVASQDFIRGCKLYSHSARTMAVVPFKLADIGEGIAEVELLQWFVKEGDTVKSFDKLCEVQSDKATVEITSRYGGKVVAVHHKEGDIVSVGSALVDIATEDAGAPAAAAPAAAAASAAAPSQSSPKPVSSASQPAVAGGKVVPFKLADIGEGIAEVELMQWFVKEGDTVKSFDKLCEVQSDKATVEITSRYGGKVVAVHHKEGDIVSVGSALVDIATEDAGAAAAAAPAAAAASAVAPSQSSPKPVSSAGQPAVAGGKVLTTPSVRKIAKENGVDLSMVVGTGPKGRILKEDMLKYVADMKNPPAAAAAARPSVAEQASPVQPSGQAAAPAEDVKVPIRGIQRMMVKSMTAAGQVPHLTYCEEIVMDGLIDCRAALKDLAKAKGVKLSYMPLIIKATALALRDFPNINATVNSDCTEVTHHGDVNMGVAMDTPKGLIVPVIRAVNKKSVFDIAADLVTLQAAASSGTLSEQQLTGGTFTLSNIGSIGGTYAVPVLVVPQVAIGALGRFQVVPRYINPDKSAASSDDIYSGKAIVVPRTVMSVSWSADHRVLDGASVARFSNVWKSYLENPTVMLASLK